MSFFYERLLNFKRFFPLRPWCITMYVKHLNKCTLTNWTDELFNYFRSITFKYCKKQDKRSLWSQALNNQILKLRKENKRERDCLIEWNQNQIYKFDWITTVLATKTCLLTLKCQNTPLMGAKAKMDDSILFPLKIVIFYCKEHFNWSCISGVRS